MRMPPIKIAEQLQQGFAVDEHISEVSAVNGYLNFKINRDGFAYSVLNEIAKMGDAYGSDIIGNGKTVCIDYSSINIAKPFHIGHLSTTVIGSALCKIFRFFSSLDATPYKQAFSLQSIPFATRFAILPSPKIPTFFIFSSPLHSVFFENNYLHYTISIYNL
jgi:hypothetical protein